ncbi:MAG: flagellar biosynthesis anti-sigma factor FlgM [Lachnospiraceae bacterium]|jgi:negative regulator of flagellin synthesis FlgM|nr:flagellar biosynthesis anti-sigma factor FlgM [Lachnospiraceae bacterium]
MRIESYSQIQSLYQTSRVSNTQKTKNTGAVTDKVSISSIGKDMKTAKDALAATPDVRADLVDSIKSRIQDGTYNVSAGSFADKLLQKYQELG